MFKINIKKNHKYKSMKFKVNITNNIIFKELFAFYVGDLLSLCRNIDFILLFELSSFAYIAFK